MDFLKRIKDHFSQGGGSADSRIPAHRALPASLPRKISDAPQRMQKIPQGQGGGYSQDNLITNGMVDQGLLPESSREIYPNPGGPATGSRPQLRPRRYEDEAFVSTPTGYSRLNQINPGEPWMNIPGRPAFAEDDLPQFTQKQYPLRSEGQLDYIKRLIGF